MRIGSSISCVILAVVIVDFSHKSSAETVNRNPDAYLDFPFYGSLPLNYEYTSSLSSKPRFGEKRRMNMEAARAMLGHSLRVRKASRGNTFAHALRVRRGRQLDAMGHTLRIKRDSWKTFNHALRVRRGDEEENLNDATFENPQVSQELFPEESGLIDEGLIDARPRRFMADRRAANGIRLHTLRIKKGDLWNKLFAQAESSQEKMPVPSQAEQSPKRPMSQWSKRKATLNHVLRVRKNEIQPEMDEDLNPTAYDNDDNTYY